MSNPSDNSFYEQLTAYLDGELGPDERLLVEARLDEDPEFGQILEQWRENADALKSLPRFRLDESFASRVMDSLDDLPSESRSIISPEISPTIASPKTSRPHASSSDQAAIANNWRWGLVAVASIAAMAFVLISFFPDSQTPETVANQTEDSQPTTSPNSEKNSNSTDTDPQLNPADEPSGHKIVRPAMAKTLKRSDGTEIKSDGHPKIIQQVVLVTVSDSISNLDNIIQVLQDHDIQIVQADDAASPEKHRADLQQLQQSLTQIQNSDQSVLVLATMPQMANVVRELSTTFQASIVPVTVNSDDLTRLKRLSETTPGNASNPPTSPFLLWIRTE